MKAIDKTNIPRKQELNQALINLGHKTHTDKRRQKLKRDKRDKQNEFFEDRN